MIAVNAVGLEPRLAGSSLVSLKNTAGRAGCSHPRGAVGRWRSPQPTPSARREVTGGSESLPHPFPEAVASLGATF